MMHENISKISPKKERSTSEAVAYWEAKLADVKNPQGQKITPFITGFTDDELIEYCNKRIACVKSGGSGDRMNWGNEVKPKKSDE